jgi:hypothetical protein
MLNREIYQKDPVSSKLVNEGVANVNDDKTKAAMSVLRYELETFVCDGQYEKGLIHILDTFLRNIGEAQQPAVWVSGYFGSGKSHLVKMLRSLWIDVHFEDGAAARDLARLPDSVKDLLMELSTQGKRLGGLHAASGTLGAGASGSVRLALLRIIFKSVGLPENYAAAKFVLWLKKEGKYETVRSLVEKGGNKWDEELVHFQVADAIYEAMINADPGRFTSRNSCIAVLSNMFPYVRDISSDEMVDTIRQTLSKDGKFPLTLVALDEVQQFIGEDSQRSNDVQEMVETCCKYIGSHLLFIGTGQTAVTGFSNMKKLEGRFTVRIELSDADVDTVIRKVVLLKKSEANKPINDVMQKNLGEISRQLRGSGIEHHHEDVKYFCHDYPILPIRRRFWETSLQVLDQTGTDSQLRNQLKMVYEVIQTNLDQPLGNVIPADFLYHYSANRLLQARILPRKFYEKTVVWEKGTPDEKLVARACGIVFLINKISANNKEIGIKATVDTIADLLVEDISTGSTMLRSKLPNLLKSCELLMLVGDEYHIQTEESSAWNDDFRAEEAILNSQTSRVETERIDRIRKKFAEKVRRTTINSGASKEPRTLHPIFDSDLPKDAANRIYIWVRDGWNIEVESVQADARQAGMQSPTIFVFIPKRQADDLRHFLIEYKAAVAVLERRGTPNTPEGIEARAVIETTKQTAEGKINEFLGEAFSGAHVYQGGGAEIAGIDLQSMIEDAAEKSFIRLYPQFKTADNAGWAKAYELASKGAVDALKAAGDLGEPDNNPVCKEIKKYIAAGKRGADIRTQFESPPYGWPADAIDGALQVMLVAGIIRAQDDSGAIIDPKELGRKNITKTFFKVESITISAQQRIRIRKLLQKAGINVNPSDEQSRIPQFLEYLFSLAEKAGGDMPKPKKPDTAFVNDLRLCTGNEQLQQIFDQADSISEYIDSCTLLAEQIEKRRPDWLLLKQLVNHAQNLNGIEVIETQIKSIEESRMLLHDPDPIQPLLTGVTDLLREELNNLDKEYSESWQTCMDILEKDENWQQLEPHQKHSFLGVNMLLPKAKPVIIVESSNSILATLDKINLNAIKDRLAALPARTNVALQSAMAVFEPKAQIVQIPYRTIKSEADLEKWLQETKEQIMESLKKGPVVIN